MFTPAQEFKTFKSNSSIQAHVKNTSKYFVTHLFSILSKKLEYLEILLY